MEQPKEECPCCGNVYTGDFVVGYIKEQGMCMFCDEETDDDWIWNELEDTD